MTQVDAHAPPHQLLTGTAVGRQGKGRGGEGAGWGSSAIEHGPHIEFGGVREVKRSTVRYRGALVVCYMPRVSRRVTCAACPLWWVHCNTHSFMSCASHALRAVMSCPSRTCAMGVASRCFHLRQTCARNG
jgi:hypothetical protein